MLTRPINAIYSYFFQPASTTPNVETPSIEEQLKKMSLADKISAGKRDEKYAFCLLERFESELGCYDKAAFDMHQSDPYFARQDTNLVTGAYYFELANANQAVKNAILNSEKLSSKLAPKLLEELKNPSTLTRNNRF